MILTNFWNKFLKADGRLFTNRAEEIPAQVAEGTVRRREQPECRSQGPLSLGATGKMVAPLTGAPFSHLLKAGLLTSSVELVTEFSDSLPIVFILNISGQNLRGQPRVSRHFSKAYSMKEKAQDKLLEKLFLEETANSWRRKSKLRSPYK